MMLQRWTISNLIRTKDFKMYKNKKDIGGGERMLYIKIFLVFLSGW